MHQRFGHLEILDEIDKTEADVVGSLLAVADVVDDAYDAPHHLAVAFGKKHLMAVALQGRIASVEQGFAFVRIERQGRKGIVPVKA